MKERPFYKVLCYIVLLGYSISLWGTEDTIFVSQNGYDLYSINSFSSVCSDSTRSYRSSDYGVMDFKDHGVNQPVSIAHAQKFRFFTRSILANSSTEKVEIFIHSNVFRHNIIYEVEDNRLIELGHFGLCLPKNKWHSDVSYSLYPIQLKPGEIKTIVIHSFEYQEPIKYYPDLYLTNEQSLKDYLLEEEYDWLGANAYSALFLGVILFLGFFMALQYWQHKDLSYLHYTLYLLFIFLYFNGLLERSPLYNYLYSYVPVLFLRYKFTSYFIFISYIYFMRSFLNLKSHLPKLDRLIAILIRAIVVFFLFDLTLYLTDVAPTFRYNMYYVFRYSLDIINVFLIIYVFIKLKEKIRYYFCIGSAVLILGAIISLTISIGQYNNASSFVGNPIFFTISGILLEALFFAAGLGYKTKLIKDEKEATMKQYISEIKKNNDLQVLLNAKLEEEVITKSEEVVEIKSQKHQLDLEKKIKELESEMLLSQMNPHFIFNSLSSLKYYVISKPVEETSAYIDDFSNLMRMILQHSRKDWVSLKEEIAFIKLYITLESRRFNSEFAFSINIEDDIVPVEEQIPPMLIQPIVENAIVHGLLTSKNDRHIILSISRSEENQNLIITIEDNGIGRAAAIQLKQQSESHAHSLATEITKDRLDVFRALYNLDFNIEIIDLYKDSIPKGTKVQIVIPT